MDGAQRHLRKLITFGNKPSSDPCNVPFCIITVRREILVHLLAAAATMLVVVVVVVWHARRGGNSSKI